MSVSPSMKMAFAALATQYMALAMTPSPTVTVGLSAARLASALAAAGTPSTLPPGESGANTTERTRGSAAMLSNWRASICVLMPPLTCIRMLAFGAITPPAVSTATPPSRSS